MKKFTVIAALAAAALCALMARGQATADQKGVSRDTALARNLTVFNTITRYLSQYYVDSLRPDAAFEQAIAGLLYTVDPYTEYYDAEQVERLEIMTTGA